MTIVGRKTTVCCLCGNDHEYSSFVSLHISGPVDLDGSGGIYSYIGKIMRCEHCGYCSKDLFNLIKGSPEIIKTDEYKIQLNDKSNDEYINTLLCYLLLEKSLGDNFECGFTCLKISWQFDYKDIPEKYIEYRLKALSFFEKDIKKLYEFSNNDGTGKIIHIDLLRRTKQFDKAMEILEKVEETISDEELLVLLHFERSLILNRDDGRYDTKGNINNHTEVEYNKESEKRILEEKEWKKEKEKDSILRKIIKKVFM